MYLACSTHVYLLNIVLFSRKVNHGCNNGYISEGGSSKTPKKQVHSRHRRFQ